MRISKSFSLLNFVLLFLSLFLSSCSDDQDLLKDAIDVITTKAELKQEKQVDIDSFYLDEKASNDLNKNRGNLLFSNVDNLKKKEKYKLSKRDQDYDYQYFSSYIDSKEVITAVSSNSILRYDLENKQKIWQIDLPIDNEITFLSGGIIKEKDYVIITLGNSSIYTLDYNSGELLWSKDIGTNIRSKPLLIGDNIYVQTITNKAFSIDYTTGETVWFNDFSTKLTSIFGSGHIVSAENMVILPSSHGYITALEKNTGKKIWIEKVLKPGIQKSEFTLTDIEAKMLLNDSVLYVASYNDSFIAADVNTGKRLWQREIGIYKDFWLSGNYLYAIDIDNKILAVDVNDGQIIWVSDALDNIKEDECYSKPFIVDGYLSVITSRGEMLLFDARTGELLHKRRVAEDVCEDFYIDKEELYLLTPKGRLYKYAG